jgi:penicillin-binding protein 1A
VQAKRQPGSAFKPFLYSAALEQGFTPASMINDAPLVIEDPTLEGSWRPQNVTREFRGPMRLREALVRSRNLVSIRIMNTLGPAYATQYIERFGFPEDSLPRNLSLALGTASVSPLDMAGAYAIFANGGFRVEPYYLDRIIGPDSKTVYEAQPRFACPDCTQTPSVTPLASSETEGGGEAPIHAPSTSDEMRWGGETYLKEDRLAPSAISPQNDYLMTDMMSDVIRRGTATRALVLKRGDLAGKTGTTNDRRDTWFCGFNAGLVGTAWVGFDQERSLPAKKAAARHCRCGYISWRKLSRACRNSAGRRRRGWCRCAFPQTPARPHGRGIQTPSSRLSWRGICPPSRSSTARSANSRTRRRRRKTTRYSEAFRSMTH